MAAVVKAALDVAVPAATFILLAAVGLELTASDFVRVLRQRTLVLVGLLAPPVLLPPIAVGLIQFLPSTPDVVAGMLLVAACPIGSISNLYTYMARASTALSVTLTGLSCLFASVTIPLVAAALELALARPFAFQVPISALAGQLLLVLTLPVALGMATLRYAPAVARCLTPIFQRGAVVAILGIFVLVILEDTAAFVDELSATAPLAAAFLAASIGIGWVTAALVTTDRGDRFAITAEFGARNVGVATVIAVTFLGRIEFARFAITYSLVEVPLMLAAIALFRRAKTVGPA